MQPEINQPPDKRYAISLEFCGYAKARYVVRFCGHWVGQNKNNAAALQMASSHNADRIGVKQW